MLCAFQCVYVQAYAAFSVCHSLYTGYCVCVHLSPFSAFGLVCTWVLCAEISVPFSDRAHDMRVHLYTAGEDGEAREAGSDE